MKLIWRWFAFVVLGWYSPEREALSGVLMPLLRYLWSLLAGFRDRMHMASAKFRCDGCGRMFYSDLETPCELRSRTRGTCPDCVGATPLERVKLNDVQLDALAELIRKT